LSHHTPTSSSTLSLHDALPIYPRAGERRHHAVERFAELLAEALRQGDLEAREGVDHHACGADRLHGVLDLLERLVGREVEGAERSEEHTSELQSRENLVCRLLL